MATRPTSCRARCGGITLVEVLIAIFVLGIGLLSVLSLFTAGRDLEARAIRRSSAIGYADAIGPQIVEAWSRTGSWFGLDPDPNRAASWVPVSGGGFSLPLVIDPYGLHAGSDTSRIGWRWDRFVQTYPPPPPPDMPAPVPVIDHTLFHRVSRISPPPAPGDDAEPPHKLAVLPMLADDDAVTYSLNPDDPAAPPQNNFTNNITGRRLRETDFTPALFVAPWWQSDRVPTTGGNGVRRWLLIFHKLPVDADEPALSPGQNAAPNVDDGITWPAGFHKFQVIEASRDLVELRIPKQWRRQNEDSVKRALQPGRWLLISRQSVTGTLSVQWFEITSAMPEPPQGDDRFWLVSLKGQWISAFDLPPPPPGGANDVYLAFAFESLMYVRLLDTVRPHMLQP